MTLVVIQHAEGRATVAADGRVTEDDVVLTNGLVKAWIHGDSIIGTVGDLAARAIARAIKVPTVAAIREAFAAADGDIDATVFVTQRKCTYLIDANDQSVLPVDAELITLGCGSEIAWGYLCTYSGIALYNRIPDAFAATSQRHSGVGPLRTLIHV